MKRHTPLLFIVVIACFSLDLCAQGIRATVVGRVTDQTGAVVPGVAITIMNTGTNESRMTVTSDSGDYTVPQLPPRRLQLNSGNPRV
jgi:Carboxypeptidase regulatory-like domain